MSEPFAEGVITNETPNTTDETANTEDQSKNGGTPSNDDQINVDDVVNSWKSSEERAMQLEEENFKLKQQLASKSSDDDDDDLDEEERIEKRVQARIAEQENQKEFAMKKAEREADFMTKTSPVFRANKDKILEIAVAAKVDLREATKIFTERQKSVQEAQTKSTDAKKKGASQGAGTNSGSANNGKGSAPKANNNQSIADIYRENL